MGIEVQLDVMLARRKKTSRELARYVGITEQNISLIRSGRVKGIRFTTLERICEFLECQPGDLLVHQAGPALQPPGQRADTGRADTG